MLDNLITQAPKGDFCFNFSTGVRILQYVRNDAKSATSSSRNDAKSGTTGVSPIQPKRQGRSAKKSPTASTAPVATATPVARPARAAKAPRAAKSPRAAKAARSAHSAIKKSPSKSPKKDVSPVLPKRKGRPRKKSPLVSTVATRVSPSPAARTSPSAHVARTSPVINKSPTTDIPAIQPRRSERLRKKAEDAKNK